MNPVARLAVEILMRNPGMPAAEIVRMAVSDARRPRASFVSADPCTGLQPHPAYLNDLDPPAPFAEILRRAYAPELDPHEMLMIAAAPLGLPQALHERVEAARLAWEQRVVQPFQDQYGLVAGWAG
jgi:hypothetical protein